MHGCECVASKSADFIKKSTHSTRSMEIDLKSLHKGHQVL